MELQIEYTPGPVRVILRGPEDSRELQQLLVLLQSGTDRLWVLDEERAAVALSAAEILWAETVEDKVFVYTGDAMYRAACSLAALEVFGEAAGLFRCGKSTVVNLHAVQSLRSRPGGRIEALLKTGEKVVISRRYAPILREKLQGGC